MAHGDLNRPVVKLAPVFYDGVPSAGDVGATSATKVIGQKKLLKLEKLRICQNSKMVKTEIFTSWDQNLKIPPVFWKRKPE